MKRFLLTFTLLAFGMIAANAFMARDPIHAQALRTEMSHVDINPVLFVSCYEFTFLTQPKSSPVYNRYGLTLFAFCYADDVHPLLGKRTVFRAATNRTLRRPFVRAKLYLYTTASLLLC